MKRTVQTKNRHRLNATRHRIGIEFKFLKFKFFGNLQIDPTFHMENLIQLEIIMKINN